MLNQAKYDGMYLRYGRLGDSKFPEMEWIDDHRSFDELIPNALDFVKNLLDILVVDTPNIESLSYFLGDFIKKGEGIYSKKLTKDYLQEVEIYPFVPPSKYETEVSEIKINFTDKVLLLNEFQGIVNSFAFKEHEGKNSFIFHGVKFEDVSFEADLIMNFQVENDYVTKLNFRYKRL